MQKIFIHAADLPETALSRLRERGLVCVPTDACPFFSEPVRFHPDLQFFLHPDGSLLSLFPHERIKRIAGEKIKEISFPVSSNPYKNEAKLNILLVGDRFFANTKLCYGISIPPFFEIIHVSQGYAACSSIPVGENALITDDPSVAKAARAVGIQVLQIQKGDVKLAGYPYGFIGGASAKIGEREIAFFGELFFHRDGEAIRDFLSRRGFEVTELLTGPLRDYGGGILLK